MITSGPNYNFILDSFIEAKKGNLKGIGLEGASRTGKSWDISIFICQYLQKYTGKTVVIARDNLATLKDTTYETLKKVWKTFDMPMGVFNKSASDIYYNGNIIKFTGINDDLDRVEGFESDLLWINEIISVNKEGKDGLEQRNTEFFIYDYNPKANEHYVYDMELRDDYRCLKTNIFDNEYAPKNSVRKILSYAHPEIDDYDILKDKPLFNVRFKTRDEWEVFKQRNIDLKTADLFRWEVYGLGKRAVSEDLIFPEFELYKEDLENYDWKLYGGDFGYKEDPTAFVQVIKAGNNIYLKLLIYEYGLMNPEIATRVIEGGWVDAICVWDSAEQKSIDELIVNGLGYADKAEKGAGSLAWGVQKMQQYRLFIHEDSKQMIEEFKKYRWAKDSKGEFRRNSLGKMIPFDKDNHTIDASRYAITYYLEPSNKE